MNWLRENWFWIAIGIFFLWSHGKMHGGHGGHGGHSGHGGPRKDPRDRKDPGDQGDPHAQH